MGNKRSNDRLVNIALLMTMVFMIMFAVNSYQDIYSSPTLSSQDKDTGMLLAIILDLAIYLLVVYLLLITKGQFNKPLIIVFSDGIKIDGGYYGKWRHIPDFIPKSSMLGVELSRKTSDQNNNSMRITIKTTDGQTRSVTNHSKNFIGFEEAISKLGVAQSYSNKAIRNVPDQRMTYDALKGFTIAICPGHWADDKGKGRLFSIYPYLMLIFALPISVLMLYILTNEPGYWIVNVTCLVILFIGSLIFFIDTDKKVSGLRSPIIVYSNGIEHYSGYLDRIRGKPIFIPKTSIKDVVIQHFDLIYKGQKVSSLSIRIVLSDGTVKTISNRSIEMIIGFKEAVQQLGVTTTELYFCGWCRTQLVEGDAFCGKCGRKI